MFHPVVAYDPSFTNVTLLTTLERMAFLYSFRYLHDLFVWLSNTAQGLRVQIFGAKSHRIVMSIS